MIGCVLIVAWCIMLVLNIDDVEGFLNMTIEQIAMLVAVTGIVCVCVYFIERWLNDDND